MNESFGVGLPPIAPPKKTIGKIQPARKATKAFNCRVCGCAMDDEAISMRPSCGYICTPHRKAQQNEARRSPDAEENRKALARLRSRGRTQEELRRDHMKAFAKKLRLNFGINPPDFEKMLLDQAGKCAICGDEPSDGKRLRIDHCHTSGKIRGLLCHSCNVGLGLFKDNVERMKKAIAYLLGE